MKKYIKIFVISIVAFAPFIAEAHQPRLIGSPTEPILIEKPEVSKAYYGVLNGEEQHFFIEQSDLFDLYVNVVVPDVPNIDKDYIVTVYKEDQFLFRLKGEEVTWTPFFEDFGRDAYLKGPEKTLSDAEAGKYRIVVSSPDNIGKYVLVVGSKERFPLGEAMGAIKLVPRIKQEFFGKSAWSALESPFISVPIASVVVLLLITAWFVKR